MRFLVVCIAVALLLGLVFGAFFSSGLRAALRDIGANLTTPTSTIAVSSTVGLSVPSPVSNSQFTPGGAPASSLPNFHGPTTPPHVVGPTTPPPGQ